jgi:hypothetical protein
MNNKPGVIGNPALGPDLQGFMGSEGGSAFFANFLPRAVVLSFIVGALIFFFMFVTGAIQWIGSGGDKQKLESARERITSALIGIVLLFTAYAVIRFVGNFLGIDILILDINQLRIQ